MLRNILIFLLVALLLVTAWAVGDLYRDKARLYPRCGIVVEVNRESDEIIIHDGVGFLWAVKGAEDWCVGDIAAMIMDDQGTPSIKDDAVVAVTYQGVEW